MIIFDLDGTLANCEHRRHFVEVPPMWIPNEEFIENPLVWAVTTNPKWKKFKPDWDAFYEACDKDTPIQPVIDIMLSINVPYEIWSGRSESVRYKTEAWICRFMNYSEMPTVKMRPIGDYTPDEQLKERWLDETIAKGGTIDYVFDDRPKVIRMWRRRGIFVFNCNQSDGEF